MRTLCRNAERCSPTAAAAAIISPRPYYFESRFWSVLTMPVNATLQINAVSYIVINDTRSSAMAEGPRFIYDL